MPDENQSKMNLFTDFQNITQDLHRTSEFFVDSRELGNGILQDLLCGKNSLPIGDTCEFGQKDDDYFKFF